MKSKKDTRVEELAVMMSIIFALAETLRVNPEVFAANWRKESRSIHYGTKFSEAAKKAVSRELGKIK